MIIKKQIANKHYIQQKAAGNRAMKAVGRTYYVWHKELDDFPIIYL